MTREVVLSERAKDKFCQKLDPGTYQSKREIFVGQEGFLYRRRNPDRYQLVVPKSLIQDAIRVNHDPSYVADPDIKRTHDVIALNY